MRINFPASPALLLFLTFPLYSHSMEFSHGGATSPCRDPEACHFWVEAKGEILPDSLNDLKRYLENSQWDNYYAIRFNSPGGNLGGALRMGEWLRSNNFITETEYCASACVFAFLGGVKRILVGENAEIGVHRFYREDALENPSMKRYTGDDLDSVQRVMAGLMFYTQDMGVDLGLISLMGEAAPSSMKWVDEDTLYDLRVVYDPEKWLPWEISPEKNGLIATSQTQDKTKNMNIFCSEGRRFFQVNSEGLDEEWLRQCRSHVSSHPVLGINIPSESVYIIGPSGSERPWGSIMFELPSGNIPFSSSGVFRWEDMGHYSMACTDINDDLAGTLAGLKQSATLALKNCLDQ